MTGLSRVMDQVTFDDRRHAEASEEDRRLFAPLLSDPLSNRSAPAPQGERAILKRGTNYSHDKMIDLILTNPGITQNELAAVFGYTPGWISQVINSDAFKAKLAERSREVIDPVVIASMEEQFQGILARGLELTRAKLDATDKEGNSVVSDNFLLRSMELSSRALGYGSKKDEGGRSDGLESKLIDLQQNLVGLLRQQRRAPQTIDMGQE